MIRKTPQFGITSLRHPYSIAMFDLTATQSNIKVCLLVGFLFICLNKIATIKENMGSNDLLFTEK